RVLSTTLPLHDALPIYGVPVLSPPLSTKVMVVVAPPAPVEEREPTPTPSTSPGKVLVGRLSAPPSYTTEIEEEKPRPKKKLQERSEEPRLNSSHQIISY